MSTACAPLQAVPRPALRRAAPIERLPDRDCADQQVAEQPGPLRTLVWGGVQTQLGVGARDDRPGCGADAFAAAAPHAATAARWGLHDGPESLRAHRARPHRPRPLP